MKDLETAVRNLAAAADELEQAMTATYKAYQGRFYAQSLISYCSKADLTLREDLQALTSKGIYSAAQCRAINGAVSAWCPPKREPVRSLAFTGRSGGPA